MIFPFPSVPFRLFMTKERFTLSPSTEDSARRLSWTTRHTQTTSLEFSGTARITSTKWTLSYLSSTDGSVCLSAETRLQCFMSYLKCNTEDYCVILQLVLRETSPHILVSMQIQTNWDQLSCTSFFFCPTGCLINMKGPCRSCNTPYWSLYCSFLSRALPLLWCI